MSGDVFFVFFSIGPGCIVRHWSPLLATSKAQQLLFRIVDALLLPHNVTQQDKALRDSLHLYLQVRSPESVPRGVIRARSGLGVQILTILL